MQSLLSSTSQRISFFWGVTAAILLLLRLSFMRTVLPSSSCPNSSVAGASLAMWVYQTESYGSSTGLRSLLTGRTEPPAST
jgi:hypothetical protein